MIIHHPAVRRLYRPTLAATAAALLATGCGKSDSTAAGGKPDAAATASSGTTATGGTTATAATAPMTIPAEQRSRLHVQPVGVSTFRPSIETNGTVAFDADVSTQVLAPISGPVTRILVQPGAEVSRGQPLALVSSPDFATAVATFRKAQGSATQARRVADLDQQLWKNDAIARRDLEQAQVDAQNAEADRDAALQQLRSLGVADAQIAELRAGGPMPTLEGAIRAPIAGTVVERLVNPGQLLQAGSTPTFTIADLSTVWVQANVFEADLASVHVGDAADVVTSASPTPLHGTVRYVAALVDPGTKATAVRVVVPNPARLLKRDMFVTVTLHSSVSRTGVLVPVSSVLRDEDNLPFVFVEVTPGAFARRSITLGPRVGDQYQVTAGLKAGDQLITEGGLFVQFAQSQ
jgi:cobalt-zinc-cadmium efflux system membrane fusion protein